MKKTNIALILVLGLFLFGGIALAVTCPSEGNWDSSSGVCIPATGLPTAGGGADPVSDVIRNVMEWMLRVVGIIAVIAFVISGTQYLLAAGDQNAMETAKRNLKWSIVGVIVALIGIIILNTAWSLLS